MPDIGDGNPMPDSCELLVVVCGLPRSGNHLIRDVLRKAGVQALINHGWAPGLMGYAQRSMDVRLVHPVRDLWCWEQSVAKVPGCMVRDSHGGHDAARLIHSQAVGEAACVWPMISVSYEAIVQEPETQFNMLFEWLNMDAEPVLPAIYDANEPYYDR